MAIFPIKIRYKEDLFLLSVNQNFSETTLKMKLLTSFSSTKNLPHTSSTLKITLPSIFHSECFNDKGLPFRHEVKNTEIGHLFEHILLEYLTKLKKIYDGKNVSYSGVTSWDWTRDKKGVFNIKIGTGYKDSHILQEALRKSVELVKKIIDEKIN